MNYISYILELNGFLAVGSFENGSNFPNWSLLDMIGQFFFLAGIFALIIIMAVYSLKLAGRIKNNTGGNNNLRLIETRSLGTNNYVHLVKAGDKYIVVGSSKESVTLLTELDKDRVADIYEIGENTFESRFAQQIKKFFKKDIPPEE